MDDLMIRFSDLPELFARGWLIIGVFWVAHWVWRFTGGRVEEWWVLRRARRLEDYDE